MQSQLKRIWKSIKKFSGKKEPEKKKEISTEAQKDFRDMLKEKEEQLEKTVEVQLEERANEQAEESITKQEQESAVEQPEENEKVEAEESITGQAEEGAVAKAEEGVIEQKEENTTEQVQDSAAEQLKENISAEATESITRQEEESITEQVEEDVVEQPLENRADQPEKMTETEDRTAKENTEEVHERNKKKGDYKMSREALFCDGTSSYVIPPEPEKGQTIRLRFRTARGNADTVLLVADSGIYQMELVLSRGAFDYYEISWKLGTDAFSYYFEIHGGEQVCYYHRAGVSDDIQPHYSFRIVPGFSTPDWAKGAVMYQIFVDRFYNGDSSNDVEDREYIYIGLPVQRVRDWNEPPQSMDVRRFYGGDLQGVMEKLDYLQDLGIEVIYFNPLFVSPSNHKYDIQDYDYIDPHFGKIVQDSKEPLPEGASDNLAAWKYQERIGATDNLEASNQLFIRLVEEIHRRGMRVILDGVFNHCGSFNKWMDRDRIREKNFLIR